MHFSPSPPFQRFSSASTCLSVPKWYASGVVTGRSRPGTDPCGRGNRTPGRRTRACRRSRRLRSRRRGRYPPPRRPSSSPHRVRPRAGGRRRVRRPRQTRRRRARGGLYTPEARLRASEPSSGTRRISSFGSLREIQRLSSITRAWLKSPWYSERGGRSGASKIRSSSPTIAITPPSGRGPNHHQAPVRTCACNPGSSHTCETGSGPDSVRTTACPAISAASSSLTCTRVPVSRSSTNHGRRSEVDS